VDISILNGTTFILPCHGKSNILKTASFFQHDIYSDVLNLLL